MYTFGPQERKGYVATLISTPILISTSLFGGEWGSPRRWGLCGHFAHMWAPEAAGVRSHALRHVSMACSGLGPAHLGIFLARGTILGSTRGVLLGTYRIWGGTLGGNPSDLDYTQYI